MRPHSIVETVAAPASAVGQTDTGTAFIASLFEKGPTTAQLVTSLEQAQSIYGKDTAYTQAASYLEAFFRIGGNRAWISRIVGPTPVAASLILKGTGATDSVKFTAKDVGAFANAWKVAIIAGTGSAIIFVLTDAAGNELARSPELADKAALLAYTGAAAYGTLTSAGAGTTPVVLAATNLAGGTDDNAAVTDTQRQAALDLFVASMGPGQVLLPGDTRTLAGSKLLAEAKAKNRHALIDLPDDPSATVMKTAALALRTDPNAAFGQAVGPWAHAPALVSGGTLRDIPYSIVQAAVIARQDRVTGNPNESAAGDAGQASWIVGVKHAYTDAELDAFTDAGANIALDLYGDGQVRMYGNRTLVDPAGDRLYLQASNVRLDMLIRARGKLIADRYVHRQVDAKGHVASQYAGALTGMLADLRKADALFPLLDTVTGQELDPGYAVDAGASVNTPETLAAQQLIALVGARRSPGAELVFLRITNHPVTEAL